MNNIDYRDAVNRRDGFINWCAWSIKNNDCDPALWLLNYLFDRFEHNIEQKYWIAWIYGTTYHLPTAWIIWNEFPDFELVDQERLVSWNNTNYKILRYQTDTKYNKGYLPQQFASYRKWIKHNNPSGTQRERFNYFITIPLSNQFQSYNDLTSKLNRLIVNLNRKIFILFVIFSF